MLPLLAQCSTVTETTRSDQGIFRQGKGSFSFTPEGFGPHPDSPIDVWYYAPARELGRVRILVVLPGRGRNGEEYRDDWVDEVRREGVLLLVPEFPSDVFSVDEYNLGNLVAETGEPIPREEWTFAVVEALFDHVREGVQSEQPGYYLYGHSAGAQFVHRFVLYMEGARVLHAVSANAGWYTVPDLSVSFPYGLRGGPPVSDGDVRRMVATPLTVLLGSADDEPDADGLRDDEGSREQGSTRFERGRHFFGVGQHAAVDRNTPLSWDLEVVEGVGHSNAEMAAPAAAVLFG